MARIVDDDSMGDLFRAMHAEQKIHKENRLKRASDLIGWTKHTEYHWSRLLNGAKLNWWPTTNRWSYGMQGNRPMMHYGPQDALLAFIINREIP